MKPGKPANDDDPPVRLVLAALFHAARLVAKPAGPSREELIKSAIADADELLRQVSE
jgi:hypothetical protein